MARLRERLSSDVFLIWAVILLGLVLYAGSLGHPLIGDDHTFVLGQPFTQDCSNLLKLADPRYYLNRVLPVTGAARPVWLGSVIADSCIYGGAAAGYHLSSLLWHVCASVLLMALAWTLCRDDWTALGAGVLFVANPLHTENVNIITFRTDILALAFMTLAFTLYLLRRSQAGWRRLGLLGLSLACYGLAVLAKEMAVTLPLLVVLGDWLFPESRTPKAEPPRAARRLPWRAAAAFALVLLCYLWFRMPRAGNVVLGHQDFFSSVRDTLSGAAAKTPEGPTPAHPAIVVPWQQVYESPKARLLTMARIMGEDLSLLLWPHPLQGDYSPRPAVSWREPGPMLAVLAWLGVLVLAWALRRRLPMAAFGLLWLPVTLLPVSGLWLLHNLQADRYLYVPSAGIALAAAAALSWLTRRAGRSGRLAAPVLAAAIVASYALMTASRNLDYQDDASLQAATVAADPGVARAHFNLAQILRGQGRLAAAEAEYRAALELWPDFAAWRTAFAIALLQRGRVAEAADQLQASLKQDPGDPAAHYFLGVAHWRAGRRAKAAAEFDAALRLDPADRAAAQAKAYVAAARKRAGRKAAAPAAYLDSARACSAAAWEQARLMLSMPCSAGPGR
ncbi:MAG: tetratricopeptide repeat protein [Elusimicrobia bacterium]|nr:tetratricopeptide repeat protein [Elusimicrobiota bacterium]